MIGPARLDTYGETKSIPCRIKSDQQLYLAGREQFIYFHRPFEWVQFAFLPAAFIISFLFVNTVSIRDSFIGMKKHFCFRYFYATIGPN